MASGNRHVDTLPAPEKVDNVQVLSFGLSRTGTLSMFKALKILGLNSYHMWKACDEQHRNHHLTMWQEAMEAKFPQLTPSSSSSSPPAPYTSSDFHKLLKDYETTADIPSLHFVPELLAAYPKAKILLTTHPRGTDAWLKSVHTCLYQTTSWRIWDRLMFQCDPFCVIYITHLRRALQLWTGLPWPEAGNFAKAEPLLRDFYAQHNDTVRRLAREQNREILEFDPRQGWEPLCKFLGKDVPEHGPYPHINEGNFIVYVQYWIIYRRLWVHYGKYVNAAAVLAVAGVAWTWRSELAALSGRLLLAGKSWAGIK